MSAPLKVWLKPTYDDSLAQFTLTHWSCEIHFSGYTQYTLTASIPALIEAAKMAERERCAKIAKSAWLSALVDLEQYGIGNADREMELCEFIAAAIRGETE